MREGWEYKKLGDIFAIAAGGTPSRNKKEYWNGDIPWVKIKDIRGKYVNYVEEYITEQGLKNSSAKMFCKGTLLYTIFATLGEVAILNIDATTNQAIAGLKLNDNAVVLEFAYYYLQSLKQNVLNIGKGVAQKNINLTILRNLDIPVPLKSVQLTIVAELDQINDLIRLKKEQLKEYDNLAQSIFYDMFGDPVENEKGWEVKKLKDISKVKIGPFGSLLHVEDYVEGGRPVVNPVHMNGGRIVADKNFSVSEEKYKELSSYVLKENDIVFGRRGDIGRCALVSKDEDGFICGTGSLYVRFDIVVNTMYILKMLLTNSIKSILISKAKGATMLNINCGIVENLQIPLPPLSLQQEFSSRIEQIEKLKTEVQKTITDLETLLASRTQYWFE